MMDDPKVHHLHSLPLQELAVEKPDPRYGLNLWLYSHKGHRWHEDLQKGISSLGQHSLPLSLEVEQSQEWSHHISALQTSPGGKSSVSQRGLTPSPHPSLKWLTQIMMVRWTNNKKVCFFFFFHLAGNQPASFGNLQGKSQSSWQWPLKCSTVLKYCIFPGHILWYKQKRKRRRKMTVVLLFVEIKQLFFAVSLHQTCRHNPKMT